MQRSKVFAPTCHNQSSCTPVAPRVTPRRSARSQEVRTLAIGMGPDGAAPSEFRLFTAGWNDTEHGPFLFDDVAAKSVMAAHEKWGVDLMIDLEHQALEVGAPSEPTARDARGWFRLELRPDGSLWATGVTWTPDGMQRLAEKRQRYVSPAFGVDTDTSRITSIINVALVAIPATHETPALVAASGRGASMLSAELVKEALDALQADDSAKAMELLKGILAEAASGEPADEPAEEPPAEEPAALAAAPGDKPEEVVAALGAVTSLSGKSLVASVADIRTWHASHVTLAAERKVLADREAVLESAERRKLCIEMVTLGGRAPATVWSDSSSTAPKAYLAAMPIADLRAMHADTVRASARPVAIAPPAGATAHGLTDRQLAKATAAKIDPAKYAATLSSMSTNGKA